jgi:hypothetical protein
VPDHKWWHWWRGVTGLLYARLPKTSPPKVVRAEDMAGLVEKITAEEKRRPPGRAA